MTLRACKCVRVSFWSNQACYPRAAVSDAQAAQSDALLAPVSGKTHFHFLLEQKLVTSPSQPGAGEPGGIPGGAGRFSVCCCYPRWIPRRFRDGGPGPCDSGAGGSKALSGQLEACPPMQDSGKQRSAGCSRSTSLGGYMSTAWRCLMPCRRNCRGQVSFLETVRCFT